MIKSLAILGTRGIPARYGGFETFAEELSVRLVELGIEVTVYCEKEAGQLPDSYRGVRLEYIRAPRLGPLTTILFDLLCLWHARKAFDVVYMLGYGASLFCFLPRIWGTRVWINMDGVEWARSKWSTLAKLWFRMMEFLAMWTPNRVIADAQGILSHLQSRHLRVPPASVIAYGAPVIEAAPDPAMLDEWQLAAGDYYLVVCRLEPENSVKEIVQGYLRSESGHPLVVVGGIDPARSYVNELLQMNDGRVRFIGPVYDKGKLQALRYHSLAYFHGHTAGGTNPSLLEALGCGNLVIAHDNVFNREVAGTVALYFYEEKDIPQSIRTVESYPKTTVRSLKSMAQGRIRNAYSWNAITEAYVTLLTASVPQQAPEKDVQFLPLRKSMNLKSSVNR